MVDNPFASSSSSSQQQQQQQQPLKKRRRMFRTTLFVLGFVIIVNFGLVWIVDTLIVVDDTTGFISQLPPPPPSAGRLLPYDNDNNNVRNRGGGGAGEEHQLQVPWPTMPPRGSSTNTSGFIHVGKTAGSTISLLLRNGCTSFKKGPCRNITDESAISKYVEHYYHVPDFFRLPTTNHESYIISVRDVYDRTVSAFLYHHPANTKIYNLTYQSEIQKYQNEIAYTCFPTLETFAVLVNGRQTPDECNYPHRHNVVEISDCQALACAVLHGKVRKFQHLFFNYRNILYTKIPQSTTTTTATTSGSQQQPRKLYSLRQEYLWKDWTNLNVLLGQPKHTINIPNNNTTNTNLRNVTGYKLPVSRNINPKAKSMLCQALYFEYIAYFTILIKSRNLHSNDIDESSKLAQQNCPNLDIPSIIQQIQQQQQKETS